MMNAIPENELFEPVQIVEFCKVVSLSGRM